MTCFAIGIAIGNVVPDVSGSRASQDLANDEECKNKYEYYCKEKLNMYGIDDACSWPEVKRKCRRSCGLCKSDICDNLFYESSCKHHIRYYDEPCKEGAEYTKGCKASCGLCSDVCEDVGVGYLKPTDCKGEIERNSNACDDSRFKLMCRRSCGLCQACEDKESYWYCKKWSPYNCQMPWMKNKCDKSCGKC